jgi:hypothetical protein
MPLFVPQRRQMWTPSDNNLVGGTYDTATAQAATIWPASGTLNVARLLVTAPVVTNIIMHFTVAGGTLTTDQCFAGLYNAAGALLGAGAVTADQSVVWATGGLKTMPLTVAQAVAVDQFYYVGWYAVGSTMPTQTRALNSNTVITNVGLAAPNFRFATADTGLTTAMPANIGTMTGSLTSWGVWLS